MDDTQAQLFEDLERYIENQYASSRQRSLALTKLEECYLWLQRAELAEGQGG